MLPDPKHRQTGGARRSRDYAYRGPDVAARIRETYGFDGDLADIFANVRGQQIHKWHHYIPLYDRYFGAFRDKDVKFLEIGVCKGGSLQMWRRYFGESAKIYGIDIDKRCAAYDGDFGEVRIGSQDDPEFLRKVVDEMDGVDIILDDGSHQMDHIEASLRTLFPLLNMGGVYMIEDLHAAYWGGYGGGFRKPKNFFNTVRRICDDLHKPYHPKDYHIPELAGTVTGMHVHDSIVVLDKGAWPAPAHSKVV